MTADSPEKFLFDRDFSPETVDQLQLEKKLQAELETELAQKQSEEEEIPEDVIPTFSEEDLENARNDGFQAGHDQATTDLSGAIEQRLIATLENVSNQINYLADAYQKDHEERSRDAVAVATVIVRKLFPALNMDNAMAEIRHMIVEAMNRTSGAPTFIIRVPSELSDEVEGRVDNLAALRGREGTITVLADDSLKVGDAAVEWDGGGMVRDTNLLWQEIDEIIERNLGSERANGHILTETPEHVETPPDAVEKITAEDIETEITQEVVNDAPVGENMQSAAESLDDSPQAPKPDDLAEKTPPESVVPEASGDIPDDAQDQPTVEDLAAATQMPEQNDSEDETATETKDNEG